ncbi:hypothetical protein HW555_004233 [Spodoptera exigua]|uniref:Uncharacterized protein n=1 Tax=Spodoptera exigua TaxID=7107 RepID=A0A835L6B7_SPOEX|nr:hypothetical protein HW555_004233 [Spodoptera exigua]
MAVVYWHSPGVGFNERLRGASSSTTADLTPRSRGESSPIFVLKFRPASVIKKSQRVVSPEQLD